MSSTMSSTSLLLTAVDAAGASGANGAVGDRATRWVQVTAAADVLEVLDHDDIVALCDIEDPIEAASALLGRWASVRRIFLGPPSDVHGLPLGAAFLLDHGDDQHSWLGLFAHDMRNWVEAGDLLFADRVEVRRDRLDVVLGVGETPTRLGDALGDPRLGQKMTIEQTSKLEATAQMWWSNRIGEGHTAESASLLLALTLAPANAALMAYDVNGLPVATGVAAIDESTLFA